MQIQIQGFNLYSIILQLEKINTTLRISHPSFLVVCEFRFPIEMDRAVLESSEVHQ